MRATLLRATPAGPGAVSCRPSTSSRAARRGSVQVFADRTFCVGGNWKSNCTRASVAKLVAELNEAARSPGGLPPATECEVIIAPEHIHLSIVLDGVDPRYKVAAQNCWDRSAGAYTGEIAAEALLDLGVSWVILGHSERRSLLGESNEFVGAKVEHAIEVGMDVIACVGETLAEREAGSMFKILDAQLKGVANKVAAEADWARIIVAYEPVWAIGTGVVATPEQAQEAHAYIRQWLKKNVSPTVAEKTRIMYGGSVNDANAATLAQKPDIDGFLVGGASLKGDAFAAICRAKMSVAA